MPWAFKKTKKHNTHTCCLICFLLNHMNDKFSKRLLQTFQVQTVRDLWDGYWPAFISTGAAVEPWMCWIGSHICLQPLTGGKLSGALVSEWRSHMFRSEREVGTTQQGNRLRWRQAFPARLRLWRLLTDGATFSSSLRAEILCGFKSLLLRCCHSLKNCWGSPEPLSFRKRLGARTSQLKDLCLPMFQHLNPKQTLKDNQLSDFVIWHEMFHH